MKTKIILCSILMFFCTSLRSQYFWTEQVTPVTARLNSVSNINGTSAWVVGDSGTILQTSDNGYTWINESGTTIPLNVNLSCVFAINSANVFTAGNNGNVTYLYRTTMGGGIWDPVFMQTGGYINAVWMTNAQNGFMTGNPVGGRWSLWKTSNGGTNWDSSGLFIPQNGSETGFKNSLRVSGTRIWFGTNNSGIYYSSNYGANWISQSISPDVISSSLWMDTTATPLGFSSGSTLIKTTNGGINWQGISLPGSGSLVGVTMVPQNSSYVWCVRNSSNIYMSQNQGVNWTTQYSAPSGNYTYIGSSRVNIYGPGIMYALRDNGKISRSNVAMEGVTLISTEIPAAYRLEQNYPNPFNSSTVFRFETSILRAATEGEKRGGYVSIIVYDALGREAGSMVNEVIQPGTYKVSWDGNAYPSGIYFYRLIAVDPSKGNSVYTQTRKMVLLK